MPKGKHKKSLFNDKAQKKSFFAKGLFLSGELKKKRAAGIVNLSREFI